MLVIGVIISILVAIAFAECLIVIPLRQIYIYRRMRKKGFKYLHMQTEVMKEDTHRLFRNLVEKDFRALSIEALVGIVLTIALYYVTLNNNGNQKIMYNVLIVATIIIVSILRLIQMGNKMYAIRTLSDILVYGIRIQTTKHGFEKKNIGKHGINRLFSSIESDLESVHALANKIKSKEDFNNSTHIKHNLEKIELDVIKLEARLAGLNNAMS